MSTPDKPAPDSPPDLTTDGDNPIHEAEAAAAAQSTQRQPLGRPGRPLNRRSPFFVGLIGAAGVAVTYLLVQILLSARTVLILVGLAWFIALGLEPVVAWLVARTRMPRRLAVLIVFVGLLGLVGGFLAAAIPVVVTQATQFVHDIPALLHQAQDHTSLLGRLNDRFHLQQHLQQLLAGGSSDVTGQLVGVGQAVFSGLADFLIVVVLTVYFVADLPRIRATAYRLVPASRRPRAILLGDEIFAKVGAYVLGNVLVSVISGLLTCVWLLIFHVPDPLLLGIAVAVLDLIPVVGSTAGGVIVCLVALTVSWPVCIATIAFFLAYRAAEDYLLVPKIIGGVLKVPALVTVVAVLLGGALLGIVGALVAIPAAAAVLLLAREVLFPRLDGS
ncbi:MAG TPA: AI-2E family transporter [Pseudonocardiaceae bacterium]|nr:AI-2E family transporter [Pseudonocardiaceae bacterium]